MSKLVAPHMAPLAAILALGTNFGSQSTYQQVIGITSVIPLMKLKPEHITELTTGLAELTKKRFLGQYAESAKNRIAAAHDQLVTNNAQAQNGAGDTKIDPAIANQQNEQADGKRVTG